MNSFLGWVGSKKKLRDIILPRFPLYYERYIEVFGGGGSILFHKSQGNDFEVYNDLNDNLTTLFRCVRDQPDELMDRLRLVVNSRTDFNRSKELFKDKSNLSELERAALFYQLNRYSYASGGDSFGCQPHDLQGDFPLITQAHRRLRKVVIENQDFETLIRHYDRPVSFFYCDPPYYGTEDMYEGMGFGAEDHIRLRDLLFGIEGKFMVSYNDCPFIRELYASESTYFFATSRIHSMVQRWQAGAQFDELLITNYDMADSWDASYPPSLFTFADLELDDDYATIAQYEGRYANSLKTLLCSEKEKTEM